VRNFSGRHFLVPNGADDFRSIGVDVLHALGDRADRGDGITGGALDR
jgi:hypothetical protein